MVKDPILIVGAGPSGLVTAIWLKHFSPSTPFRIISKASGPGTTSKAMVVHARTLEYYRQLGIAEKLIAKGVVLNQVNIWRHGTQRGQLDFLEIGQGQSHYPLVLSVTQDAHELVLLEHLKTLDVKVEWEQEVQDLQQFSDHVQVTINGDSQRFSYVAGCDGAHSVVRKACNLQMAGGTYPQHFFVADVRTSNVLDIPAINIAPDESIMTVFIKLSGDGHFRIIGAYMVPDDVTEPTYEHVRDKVKKSTTLDVTKVEWFSVYRVRHTVVENFRERRVFLVGDAAHLHSPVGGQGMNTGISDAANLAWKLASVHAGSAPDVLLDTYHPERNEFAKTLVNTTDRLFTFMTSSGIIGWFTRAVFIPYVLPWIWKIPRARPQYFKVVSQIGSEFSHSPLSESDNQKKGVDAKHVFAGQRLPWVQISESEDTHDPFPKPQWHIVQFLKGEGEVTAASGTHCGLPVRTYVSTAEAEKKGFVQGKAYLVRPDGYVGIVADGLEDRRLGDYMKKWGVIAL